MTPPHPRLASHAVALVAAILEEERLPADQIVARHFREHRQLGARERPWIADLAYQTVRWTLRLRGRAGGLKPAALVAACLLDLQGWTPAAVAEALGEESVARLLPPAPPASPAEEHGLPPWLWEELDATWGAEAPALAGSLNQPAPLHLRVNRLKAEPGGVLDLLRAEGIPAETVPGFPDALAVARRLPLGEHPLFRQGAVEVQDAGSQLVAPALDPRPGETVVDLCAGAGGKSLHIAALMGNRGRLWAVDAAAERLARLPPRLKRAGATCCRTLAVRHERDERLAFLAGKADRVLVDAPCSGLGTLRRHPELRLRLSPPEIAMLQERQAALLDAAARLVRPGGRLAYATCSLLARENQGIVTGFLKDNPSFHPIPLLPVLAARGYLLPPEEGPFLTVAPHRLPCDGFFIAVLGRRR